MKKTFLIASILSLLFSHAGAASSAVITEEGPNDSFLSPMAIMPQDFTIELNNNIESSQTLPWVSILASGENHFDYFSFSVVESGVQGIFDIDHAFTLAYDITTGSVVEKPVDTMLHLLDSAGKLIYTADDSIVTEGAGGSTSTYDPYYKHTFAQPGEYVIAIGRYLSGISKTVPGELVGDPLKFSDHYTLQISLSKVADPCAPVPLPATFWLLGSAIATAVGARKRRKIS